MPTTWVCADRVLANAISATVSVRYSRRMARTASAAEPGCVPVRLVLAVGHSRHVLAVPLGEGASRSAGARCSAPSCATRQKSEGAASVGQLNGRTCTALRIVVERRTFRQLSLRRGSDSGCPRVAVVSGRSRRLGSIACTAARFGSARSRADGHAVDGLDILDPDCGNPFVVRPRHAHDRDLGVLARLAENLVDGLL